jgi:alpha-2-macroglobulin
LRSDFRRLIPSTLLFARIVAAALAICTAVSLFGVPAAIGGGSPSVVRFSPRGTVKQVRQVTARFSESMVPLGDPRDTTAPFVIDCPAKGAGRWIDSRNWSYDFDHDLPAGLRCTFKLRAGLKSLAGNAFSDLRAFTFDTGGPSIVYQRPWSESNNIDEEQAFVLILDAEPDPASILDHAGFSVEGMPQTIGATIMGGADRETLLKRFADLTANKPVVILQARQRFLNNAAVTLIWGKGIKSKTGIATVQDQTISYKTRKVFEAKIQCERESATAGCIPLTPITLSFSAPISAEQAKQIALVSSDGARQFAVLTDPGETSSLSFNGPFKESSQYKIELPPKLVDGSGRELANASRFPMMVETGEFPPLAKFSARFGIIERADPVLPVTVRNLEAQIAGAQLNLGGDADSSLLTRIEATLWRVPQPKAGDVLSWLNRVAEAKRAESVFSGQNADGASQFAMPKPNGPNSFEVMGIPLKHPGLYIVELKSTRLGTVLLGAPKPMYVPTAALVTNLAVHFKQGQANSLVWVTALESGHPVEDADVAVADCHGTELWTGRTDARGLAMVPTSAAFANLPQCDSTQTDHESDYFSNQVEALSGLNRGLLVTASSGEDFSFVHSSWQQGIEAWRFHLPTDYQPSPYIADTVFDRTLLRAGETVHMKHFIRAKTADGLSLVAENDLPDTLTIIFAGGDQHYDFDLKWNNSGSAENDWQIPQDAKLGTYNVTMSRRKATAASPTPGAGGDTGDQSAQELSTGNFRVEEFRIPLMKAAIRMPTQPLVAVTEIPIDLSAEYLSGGAAKGLPVTLRSQINKNASPTFADFDDYVFANGNVQPGIVHTEGFSEGTGAEQNPGVHQRKDLALDGAGGARTDISDIPREPTPVEVHAELEYRDPNGESHTVSNNVIIWPAKRLVGIQVEDWASSPGLVHAHLAVVDDSGKPVAHVPVRVDIFSRLQYSYRKRLIGGFYAYENTQETKLAGTLCSGTTDDLGRLSCERKPPATGDAILQATVTDDAGNSSSANSEIFIPGNEREWFAGRDDDRMDFIPEKPAYEPGDVARFQVRMPFAEATALVTVEREGVLAASIVHLPGRNPVITLPVRDWAPNVFVSALVVRGRIAGVQPTAMLDLGKPAFKLGIAEIRVGWRDHRLSVKVAPEKSVYHVRDKALVKISVRTFDGKAPSPGGTIAVAAVDEGLLELRANDSWKLLDAMMGRRSYQVETSVAEMQVVGKRHFGIKAIPPGGGGGHQITRELFDTLLLWKASVPLDSNGDAAVEVPLNDSLTSFQIVAIADSGPDQFGTGFASIRSTQDLMLLSGVSPIIRNGDSFAAEFTVRNASERAFDATVNAKIDGLAQVPPPQKLALGPGQGTTISWNVEVPAVVRELKYHVDASVEHGPSDHLLIFQRVIPAVPVRALQATLLQVDKPIVQPVSRPADALVGVGGVQVSLSPSLAAGLDGVRDWMRQYPYGCLEQRVSVAVALGDPKLWSAIIADLPSYTDADGLLKYFPIMDNGSEVLTAYFISIAHEAGLTIPAESEATLEKGLSDFVEGRIVREGPIQAADLPLRKLAAIDALARAGHADPAMLASITIDPNLWPDSAVIDWWSILLRVPQIPDRDQRLKDAEQVMRARLNQQGTAMHLSSDPRNDMWWLMVSPDCNMVRLALLLLDNNLWHDDLPLVMRGALALQAHGAWTETITNAWGTLAVGKFAKAFESTPVAGVTSASIQSTTEKLDWASDPKGGNLAFDWPSTESDLKIDHSGSGSPWAQIRALAAVPITQPFSSGYRITRMLLPVESANPHGWKRGDLVRVHLEVEAQTDMTWVVVNDPIPAGASHLGTGLGRDSAIATSGEKIDAESFVWPIYSERAFDAFRAYYDYVPKGTFDIEYTIRLNQSGTFQLPATHVGALYEPEMFGELPNSSFEVAP